MNKERILQLRKQAHKLKPVIIIGAHGLTAAVQDEIDHALYAHELIKIRVNAADREARAQMITQICEHHKAALIQSIGHVAAVYRESDKDKD